MNADILYEGLGLLDESTKQTSFIIQKDDTVVFEKYYNGSDKDQSADIQSITKSVISALVGIAIREGYIQGVDQKLSDLFPEYFPREDDTRKNDLVLHHMLTMSAGFQWVNDEPMYRGDPMEGILSQPLATVPGEFFHYNSGLPHILSILITQESGMSTKEFAQQYFFGRLGITISKWEKIRGYHNGCCGLSLTPHDLAKIGQLYLHRGSWYGEQIVPSEWVEESTGFQNQVDEQTGYGYFWWLKAIKGHEVFSALGLGGQCVHVIPNLDLVVVATKNLPEDPADDDPMHYNLLENYLIPSMEAVK